MSCFIGVSVEQKLDPQVYQLVLSQIEDFVSETNYKVLLHEHLLIIGSRYQKFCLPRNSDFLHSNLQHFLISQGKDEEFIQIVVQSLMILKENFPHKIQIQMVSDLEQIFNLKIKIDQQIPRRLISHLKMLYDHSKKNEVNEQQVHMLIKNLIAQFHKDYKQKIKGMSLKILSEGKIEQKIWNNLSKQQIKIIDQIVNQPFYQKIGIQILQKIVRNNDYKVYPFSGEKQNNSPNSFRNELLQQQMIPEFQGPIDTTTALFQLKQSLNINRLSWIIQNIDCTKLDQKKLRKFDSKIKQVAQKYLNGYYPDVPVSFLKRFGRSLSEYQMRRTSLAWGGLVQQVLIKIEQIEKNLQKSRSKVKVSRKQLRS